MKLPLEEESIRYIRAKFQKMNSKEDLLALLNYAKKFIYGTSYKPFELRQLNYNLNPQANKRRYLEFTIKKKSGKERVIKAPEGGLKAIQKCLNLIIQCIFIPHPSATGFVLNKSIVDNARSHVGRNYVYNIDLKDFFSSIDQARVWKCFQLAPFNLGGSQNRIRIANILASICCTEMEVERLSDSGEWVKLTKNVLPQGAPTSPLVSNIVCQRLDFLLTGVAKRFGLTYTRYADDITFSSFHNVFQELGEFTMEVERIVRNQNLYINESKTRLQKQGYKQEVTGLIVNEIENISKSYRKKLRSWLYLWDRYGYDKASSFFIKDYLSKKSNARKVPEMSVVIGGKLDYLKMVKGSDNNEYQSLNNKYKYLSAKNPSGSDLSKTTSEKTKEPAPSILIHTHQVFKKEHKVDKDVRIPIVHNPKELVALLSSFSNNATPLKYATHSWEQGAFDGYEDFISKLRVSWNEIKNRLYPLSENLWAKIKAFIDAEDVAEEGWGHSNPKIRARHGWRSPSLREWCSKNPQQSPFYYPIPHDSVITLDGITTNYFYNVTEVFKRQIEIREENNHLYNIFLELRKDVLGYDFKLEQVNTKGQSFFTDVQWFRSAVTKIFESIRSRPSYPDVKVTVASTTAEVVIKIIHVNSNCTRDVDHPKIISPRGDFGSIIRELKNLCDWSIESKFGDGRYYRVNYLVSDNETDVIPIDTCEGFTHTLKFYL